MDSDGTWIDESIYPGPDAWDITDEWLKLRDFFKRYLGAYAGSLKPLAESFSQLGASQVTAGRRGGKTTIEEVLNQFYQKNEPAGPPSASEIMNARRNRNHGPIRGRVYDHRGRRRR